MKREIVKKTVNTVAVGVKDNTIIGDFFKKCSLNYFRKNYYDKFYKEHYNAVKDILRVFINYRINHVILEAPTQSGKTTVMTLMYNIVNECESFLAIKKFLGIKRVIYLTGDNQVELSEQSMDRFRKQCKMPKAPIRLSGSYPCKVDEFSNLEKEWRKSGKTPFIMVKNGDCKKIRKKVQDFTLDNTLIMVDESHYGTKTFTSQVNKLFQEYGKDFSGDPKKLIDANTYVLSVSATPYNEEFSDKINNKGDLLKGIVHYTPSEAYIGFSTMYKKNMIEGLKDNSIIKDRKKFVKFLKEQREKMDVIYAETKGERHSVIMRMQGKKTLLTELGKQELSKIANRYGFDMMIVDCNNSSKKNIDYENAYREIRFSQYEGGKNILIIVKQGFSYGISIPDDVKPFISTIYDYRPSVGEATTDSTEQGLLGRMTGYHPNGISKYLKIYIAEPHLNGLCAYHCKYPPAENPNPSTNKGDKVKCSYEEWNKASYQNEKEKLKYITLWNNDNLEPLIFKGKIVDDFFERHSEFHYDKLLSKNKTEINFLTPIVEAFNNEELNGRFDKKLRIDTRRQIGDNSSSDNVAKNLGFVNPIIGSESRREWKNPNNAGKEGWACVIDISKAIGKKGIEIRIPYGTIGFSKNEMKFKERKNYSGYQKYEIVKAIAQ